MSLIPTLLYFISTLIKRFLTVLAVGILTGRSAEPITADNGKANQLNNYFCPVCSEDDFVTPDIPWAVLENAKIENDSFSDAAAMRATL